MLSAEGCATRRREFMGSLVGGLPFVVLHDPVHLRYFANFAPDPVSSTADFGGILQVFADGTCKLFHDNKMSASVNQAHVDERVVLPWYDGKSPGQGPRKLVLVGTVADLGGRIHDALNDPLGIVMHDKISHLRRSKMADEVSLLKRCMEIGAAGQKWALANVKPGMSEIEVYAGISGACQIEAGQAVVVYGDFAVSPGMSRKGGPATTKVIRHGDLMILDFSVILFGYRSDFTNTLCVGGGATAEQVKMFEACVKAVKAGEASLRPGISGGEVHAAVTAAFAAEGLAAAFPHHAGHGLGLGHPEAPFLVPLSEEILRVGDVVTLEPGLYVDGVGGMRYEHNYLITEDGFERLSHHELRLVAG